MGCIEFRTRVSNNRHHNLSGIRFVDIAIDQNGRELAAEIARVQRTIFAQEVCADGLTRLVVYKVLDVSTYDEITAK